MTTNEQSNADLRRRTIPARLDPRLAQLVRPLLIGLIVTLLIFGLSEIVERAWLTHVEMRTLHLFHMLRGLVSTLVVAVVVGWMILKTSPGFLTATATDEAWVQQPPPTEEERSRQGGRSARSGIGGRRRRLFEENAGPTPEKSQPRQNRTQFRLIEANRKRDRLPPPLTPR